MVDWVKRVRKERAADLHNEALQGATYFVSRGASGSQLVFGALTGVGGAAVNAAAVGLRNRMLRSGAQTAILFPGALAEGFPDRAGVLAVTERSLILFGYTQGFFRTRIEAPVARIDRGRLEAWSWQDGALAAQVNFAFDDGSSIAIEVPRANKPQSFAEALRIPRVDPA